MQLSENQKNNLRKKLQTGTTAEINALISELRVECDSSLIPDLVELWQNTSVSEIKLQLVNFFNDLKDTSAIPYIIDCITNSNFEASKEILVSSCWQSGLDYSFNLHIFVQMLLKPSWQLAIEAFSVIETCVPFASNEMLNTCLSIVKENYSKVDSERQKLLNEVLLLLKESNSE